MAETVIQIALYLKLCEDGVTYCIAADAETADLTVTLPYVYEADE